MRERTERRLFRRSGTWRTLFKRIGGRCSPPISGSNTTNPSPAEWMTLLLASWIGMTCGEYELNQCRCGVMCAVAPESASHRSVSNCRDGRDERDVRASKACSWMKTADADSVVDVEASASFALACPRLLPRHPPRPRLVGCMLDMFIPFSSRSHRIRLHSFIR